MKLAMATKDDRNAHVDFMVEYRAAQDLLISSGRQSFPVTGDTPARCGNPARRVNRQNRGADFHN